MKFKVTLKRKNPKKNESELADNGLVYGNSIEEARDQAEEIYGTEYIIVEVFRWQV